MKRKIILALLVLCMLLTLLPTTVLAGMRPPVINSVSVDPTRIAAGTEEMLNVWNVEPYGANYTGDPQFEMVDPGTTYATVTFAGMFLATSPGTATVKVKVYDEERGAYFEQNVQITVYEQIIITTQSLPNGQVGVPYAVDLAATGSPKYWDWDSAELPPGLDLVDHIDRPTATIEGTPTKSGTYQVTVEASNKYTDCRAYFTIQIAEAATPTPIPTPTSTPTPIPTATETDPTETDPTATDPTEAAPTEAVENKMTQQPPAWRKGSKKPASFTSDADFKDFLHVKVDDKVVDESNYDAKEGSTVITFKPAFLESLSVGNHSVEIVSASGSAYGNIEIKAKAVQKKAKDTLPKTGEGSGYYPWLALLLISAGGLVFLTAKKKRSQQRD